MKQGKIELGFTAADLVITMGQVSNAWTANVEDYRKKDGTLNYREAHQDIERRQRQRSYISTTFADWQSTTDRLRVAERTMEQLSWDRSEDETVRAERVAEGARWRRAILKVLKQALQSRFEEYELSFDVRAGCSCSCSPGWIMRSRTTGKNSHGYIFSVTILCPPAQASTTEGATGA